MAAALLLSLFCDALVLSPSAAPLRSAAQQPVSRAGPTMILGGGGRFGGALRFTPKMPKLPKLGRGGKGPGMSDGGEGGGGEGGGDAAAPEPSDGDDSSNPLVNVWKEYERLLDEKPLLMKMATSATGFFIGDVLAQTCIQKNPEFDYFRLFRLASFGFLVHGSTSHWFYGMLDGKIPGTSAGVVASKVFIDQVLWNPIFGIMFFSYVAVLELKGLGYVVDKVQNELMTQARRRARNPAAQIRRRKSSAQFFSAARARNSLTAAAAHRRAGDGVVEGVAGGARDQLPLHPVEPARALHQLDPDRVQLLPLAHLEQAGGGGVERASRATILSLLTHI